jgi:hypothetical protein
MLSAKMSLAVLALALLDSACTRPVDDAAIPAARIAAAASDTPSMLVSKASSPTASPSAPEAATAPGYSGVWAMEEGDCPDPARTYRLSAARIEMALDERSCTVNRIGEEHPTGRSMTYMVEASCTVEGRQTNDIFTFRFGPSDTVMQMQLSDRTPVRLVRCPAA